MTHEDVYKTWYENKRQIEQAIGWRKASRIGHKVSFYKGKNCLEKPQVTEQAISVMKQANVI